MHEAAPSIYRNTGPKTLCRVYVLDTLFLVNDRLRYSLLVPVDHLKLFFRFKPEVSDIVGKHEGAGNFQCRKGTSASYVHNGLDSSLFRNLPWDFVGLQRSAVNLSPGTSNCSFANATPPHSRGSSPIAQKCWKGSFSHWFLRVVGSLKVSKDGTGKTKREKQEIMMYDFVFVILTIMVVVKNVIKLL